MKNKFLILTFLATTSLATNAWAQDTAPTIVASGNNCGTSNNCSWSLDSNGLLTISGTGSMRNYMNGVDAPWANKMTSITSVKVSDGFTNLSDWAFYNAYNVTSVDLPDSITRIGHGALGGFYQVTNLTLPNSLISIGENALNGMSGITDLTIPDTVKTIERFAFWNVSNIKNLTIPDSVETIGEYAFGKWSQFYQTEVPCVMPENLTISAEMLPKYLAALGGFAENAILNCTSGDCDTILSQWDTDHGTNYSTKVTVTTPNANNNQSNGTNQTAHGKRIYTVEEARAAVEAAGTDTVNVRIRYK